MEKINNENNVNERTSGSAEADQGLVWLSAAK